MTEDNIILFQKYVADELSSEELTQVTNRLKTDDTFKSEYDLYMLMENHVDEQVKNKKALDVLKEVGERERQGSLQSKGRSRNRILFALALGLLFLGLAYILNSKLKKQEKPSFAELYVEPNWNLTKGDNSKLNIALIKGIEGDMNEAMKEINALILSASEKNYWIGELYLKNNQLEQSLEYLSQVEPLTKEQRDRVSYLKVIIKYLLSKGSDFDLKSESLPLDMDGDYLKKLEAKN